MPDVDWDALANEATDLLQRFLRVDTSNPPGNEELAADWLAAVLAAEGIKSTKLVSAPGRANLIADLDSPGSEGPPMVLLNHTDVVPVESAYWTVDAFAGVIKDGNLWGRGTIDMKGMGIIELVVMLAMKRRGVRLRRPLRFMAVADEEAGSDYGVEWLDKFHPEYIKDAAFVINEGGYGADSYLGVERPLFGVSVAEKSPFWVTLKATGRPGHGSAPHDDNVLDRMVRAMRRIQAWEREPLMTEPVAESLRAAHAEGYMDADPDKLSPAELVSRYKPLSNLLHNTISATSLHSGIKHNVIPAVATATIDCRLVPGYEHDAFMADLRKVVDDPRIEFEVPFKAESPLTSMDTELHIAIGEACREAFPGAAVLPRVMAGFTDSRTFRRHGVPCYGFVPMLFTSQEMAGMHGNDEHVSLANLRLGVEVLYRVVERVCAA
jgi:acetylornithine deacetylase/succinyl-diaminopimelate desuccinylase-like protein